MKRMRTIVLLMGLTLLAGAVFAQPPLVVATTIFPLYDWAREVGGERVEVSQLLPPGVEAHTFAPRPSDMRLLNRAQVFIYIGDDMEPWAKDILQGLDNPSLVVVEAGREIERADDHVHGEHCEHAHHEHSGADPHVWLDPVLAQAMVSLIAQGLAKADPEGAPLYETRAQAYITELQELHRQIKQGLETCRHREIVYGGHFAFGYFARRYGLSHVSPYPGFSPNSTPTPRQVAELIRVIRATGQNTVFHEELIEPRVARVMAEETGAKLELLHGAHNLTPAEQKRGVTYLSIMNDNLAKLRAALECE